MAELIAVVLPLVMTANGALLGFIMVNLFQDTGENAVLDAHEVIDTAKTTTKNLVYLLPFLIKLKLITISISG